MCPRHPGQHSLSHEREGQGEVHDLPPCGAWLPADLPRFEKLAYGGTADLAAGSFQHCMRRASTTSSGGIPSRSAAPPLDPDRLIRALFAIPRHALSFTHCPDPANSARRAAEGIHPGG